MRTKDRRGDVPLGAPCERTLVVVVVVGGGGGGGGGALMSG